MREGLRLDRELQRRLIAARHYAGYSQPVMGEMLGGVSKKTIIEYETGEPDLRPFQVRTVVSGYADLSGVPEVWFTADWSQLEAEYEPPEREIAELTRQLSDLEQRIVTQQQFEEAVDLLRQGIDALSRRLQAAA